MPRFPGFVGPSYTPKSQLTDTERLINFYVERSESKGATVPSSLLPTPGVTSFAEVTSTSGRGIFGQSDRGFAVVGGTLYELFDSSAPVARGALLLDANPATLVTNGDGGAELFVTSGGLGYIFNLLTGAFTQVVAGVTMGGMLDAFFLRLDATTSTLGISDALDGLTWDPTQITQRSSASDPWRSMIVANSKIYLLGEQTTEVWYNAGAFPFPFQPIQGALIQYGIEAPFSVADLDGTVIWLARNKNGGRMVVQATGYSTAERISTYAIEAAMQDYTRVDDAEAFVYQELGHTFYVLNFPSANATWVFDPVGGWHERGTWNSEQARFDVWHPRAHAFIFGKHLVVERESGIIYRMSTDLALDSGGGPLRRVRRAPTITQDGKRIFFKKFQLHVEPGLGTVSGQGYDPQVLLRSSNDFGKTWGNYRRRSAGKMGESRKRLIWNRCGSGRGRVFEIVVSDPIPWRIVDAYLDAA